MAQIWHRVSKDTVQFAAILALLFALVALFGMLIPGFLSIQHLFDITQTAALLGIVSIGQTLAILTGGIDLSVAAVLVLTNVLGGEFMHGEITVLPGILCLLIGALIGLCNGVAIGYIRIPPIVTTLASMVIVTGYTYVHTGGLVKGSASPDLFAICTGSRFLIPNLTVIWLGLSIFFALMMRMTVIGRKIYAVGSNPLAVRSAGINVPSVISLTYMLSGLLAGLAGFLLVGYIKNPISGFAGQTGYTLDSIGAVVIGGTMFTGARGGIEKTIIGVLIFKILFSALVMLQVGHVGRLIITGILLIVIPTAYNRLQR